MTRAHPAGPRHADVIPHEDGAGSPPDEAALDALPAAVWPRRATRGEDGVVRLAGVEATPLAREYGTPLFVVDEAAEVARWVAEEGLGLDVCTEGEPAWMAGELRAIVDAAQRLPDSGSSSAARRLPPVPSRVVGKHCESGDVVVRDCWLPADLAPGDLVAVAATGAYCYAMASAHNKVPRPAVVAVSDGTSRLLLRRETLDDLARLEVGE